MLTATVLVTASLIVGQTSEPSSYEHLKALDFMVGTWAATTQTPDGNELTIHGTTEWILNKNVLYEEVEFKSGGEVVHSLREFLFWNPEKKQIRVMTLTSAGAAMQGIVVVKSPGKIIQEKASPLPDGKLSARMVFAKEGTDGITVDARVDTSGEVTEHEWLFKRINE